MGIFVLMKNEFIGATKKRGQHICNLSAVENGKKNMPDSWVRKIREEYSLTDEQCEQMKQSAMESQNFISLNMKNVSSINRELAVSFARQFDEMDEETSKQILNVLRNRKRSENHG